MNKIFTLLMGVLFAVTLQSCGGDELKPTIKSNDLSFSAVNTISPKELRAQSGSVTMTVNWNVTITIDGMSTTYTGTSKSNELPVMVGDEIELVFKPRTPEEKEATFSMPDGTTKTVTSTSPSFTWKVPVDFKPGSKISASNRYETDTTIYEQTGEISLIAIE